MRYTGERPTIQEGLESSRMRYKAILPYCYNKNILDYGCGIGIGSILLKPFCKKLVAYDSCEEAINNALDKNEISYLTGTFDYPHLLDNIDIIVMVEVIEHMERTEAEQFIKMIKNHSCEIVLTTPNGCLFPYHPQSPSEYRGFHKWHYTEEELRGLLNGYKFIDVSGHAWDPRLGRFTGFTAFATNRIEWSDHKLLNL
jgi:2-polyprenyl-3-methyl-5-hydroxy-6-metoxy-1,4-benzoquinol methylase